jgi:hypothetical protein
LDFVGEARKRAGFAFKFCDSGEQTLAFGGQFCDAARSAAHLLARFGEGTPGFFDLLKGCR